MSPLDENGALAILFANIRRKKRTADLVTIAEACEYLVDLYGSGKALAEKVGLSAEMIREFRKILTLPEEVKEIIRAKKMDRLDVAYRIAMLEDPGEQAQVADIVSDMDSADVRDLIRLVGETSLSIEDVKAQLLASKLKGLNIFLIDFDDKAYRAIRARARAAGVQPAVLLQQVILDWLGQGNISVD